MAEYFGRPGDGPVLAGRLHDLVAHELATGTGALPGARDVVAAVKGRAPIAVASNSPRAFVTFALVSAGLADLFDLVYAADDVANPKPAPDLYLTACAGLGVNPARSVAFEDSRTGVASARAAGMYVIGVPSLPGVTLDADHCAASMTDLVPWAAALTAAPATGRAGT